MLLLLSFLLLLNIGPCWAQDTQTPEPSHLQSPTVTLEAKVVQIVLNDEHRQGVDWEAIVSDFHNLQLKKEGDLAWFDKKYNLSVGEVSKDDYAVLLDALDTVGRVTQTDFSSLVIAKGELKTEDVSPNPKGLPLIHLDLMWVNTPSGEAKVRLAPTVELMLKDSNLPSKAVLKNQTELELKDNTAIVIGGLMQEEEITKTKKIPVLGNLPLVGLVFRKQGKLMHKTETIIFLTVHTNFVQSEEPK
jgi:hypothetical protein